MTLDQDQSTGWISQAGAEEFVFVVFFVDGVHHVYLLVVFLQDFIIEDFSEALIFFQILSCFLDFLFQILYDFIFLLARCMITFIKPRIFTLVNILNIQNNFLIFIILMILFCKSLCLQLNFLISNFASMSNVLRFFHFQGI